MSWGLVRSSAFVRATRKHLRRHPEQAADLRIIFRLVKSGGKQAILLETAGTHDEVY